MRGSHRILLLLIKNRTIFFCLGEILMKRLVVEDSILCELCLSVWYRSCGFVI
jgi:hypothetical protein